MCDYSLDFVASRPALVADKLVSTSFCESVTHGFAAADDPNVAVCLLPGTELSFENDVEYETNRPSADRRTVASKVAVFRQVNVSNRTTHHDALEFPNGHVVLVNDLREGQVATVLQLPAAPRVPNTEHEQANSVEPSRPASLRSTL
jgi:hypothetical protein